MSKKPAFMTKEAYEAAMGRIKAITGTRTQVQLADALNVRQSSISDAKRRNSIPSDWLLKILLQHNAHPAYILTGQGPATIGEVLPARMDELHRAVNGVAFALSDMRTRLETAMLMATMTPDELTAHKAQAEAQLGAALRDVIGMSQQLQTARTAAGMEV